jgi:hypothetical protein
MLGVTCKVKHTIFLVVFRKNQKAGFMDSKSPRTHTAGRWDRLYEDSKQRNMRRKASESASVSRIRELSQKFRITPGSRQYLSPRPEWISLASGGDFNSLSTVKVDCLEEEATPTLSPIASLKSAEHSNISLEIASTKASTQPSPIVLPSKVSIPTRRVRSPIPTPSPRPRRERIAWSELFSAIVNDIR